MLCHANAQIVEAIFLSFPPLIAVGTGLNNFIETKGYNFDKYEYQLQSTWNQIPTQMLLLLFFLLSCFLSMCIATNIQPLFNMVDVVHDFYHLTPTPPPEHKTARKATYRAAAKDPQAFISKRDDH